MISFLSAIAVVSSLIVGRVVDAPHPVHHAVLICHFGVRRAVAVVENLLHAARRVGVEHENLPEVRARCLQQVQPVAFGL